jgi:hypothetical protein
MKNYRSIMHALGCKAQNTTVEATGLIANKAIVSAREEAQNWC